MSEAADDAGKDLRETEAPRRPRERRATEGDVAPTRELLKGSPNRAISTEKGDVPDALSKRYFTQSSARAVAFYAEYNAPKPAFRDAGARLSTSETNPNTIRDMVDIAEHRGWQAIQVRGTEDFKREVWLEAQSRGLEVRGFRPNQRDFQELERRSEARDKGSLGPAPLRERTDERSGPSPAQPGDRVDYDAGVRGRLLEIGRAPFRGRQGAAPAPFLRIQPAEGKPVQIWGVTLPAAISRSGAKVGDEITLRREGVERVSDRSGEAHQRNRWTVEAARLRESDPAEAARDPALKAAQATLGVVASVARQRLDPDAAARVVDRARSKAAERMEDGARFREPSLMQAQRQRDRGASAGDRNSDGPERVRRR